MAYDYSVLFESEDGVSDTWREFYVDSQPLSWNLVNILEKTVFLPHDFYDIIAAYLLLPSALCRVVPYLFLYGRSGSGKSTLAKIGSYLHGVSINSSSDTFAGIRNSLDQRRNSYAQVPDELEPERTYSKRVEKNTCMVWDDIDSSVFINNPDLYRLFKFGYDRTTDMITISSKEVGENLRFHCFCPKIFSSISPMHLDDRFKELRRRLIVIPCKRVEDLSDQRKNELGIIDNAWETRLINIGSCNWKGFSNEFQEFWDLELASAFITTRKLLSQSVRGLSSQQRTISLDLMATGIASGIWQDEQEATDRMKFYWSWFKGETEKSAGLGNLLATYIKREEVNAKNAGRELEIYTSQLRSQIENWVSMGWLYEKPHSKEVKETLLDLGMRLRQGKWVKG